MAAMLLDVFSLSPVWGGKFLRESDVNAYYLLEDIIYCKCSKIHMIYIIDSTENRTDMGGGFSFLVWEKNSL